MDALDKIRSMTPRRQITLAIGIFAILAVVMGGVYFVFLRQPDAVLFSNLRPMDAATIVAELDKRKTSYHLADEGTTILVAKNQVDATRLAILSQDLPLKGSVGFELFNKSDIGLTEFAQKINYQRALQGELARTIMAMDAIDTARVHLSLPEPTIFRDDKRPAKASIALTLKPGKDLAPGTVMGIRRLVAAAVPDLDSNNVVVVDGEGEIISSDATAVATNWETPGQHAAETYYTDTIQRVLASNYPSGVFAVQVAASPVTGIAPLADGATGSDTDSMVEPFLDWSPSQRHFRLKINIHTPLAGDPAAAQNIRSLVGSTIGADTQVGDEVTVSSDDADPVTRHVRSDPHKVSGNPVTKNSLRSPRLPTAFGSGTWIAFLAILLTASLYVIFRFVRQLMQKPRPQRRLSEAERQALADRFRALLERGGDRAAD